MSQAASAPTSTALDLQDPLALRTQALSSQLRCLVCQNQTIADSQAPLAVDLKNQVREQLQAGRSDAEILRYMTDRYGDFVLYKPPLQTNTALLWAGPALLMGGALLGLAWVLRRRQKLGQDAFEAPPEDPAP
ncbi:cytochrome c-type biogenesis protein [Inhella sp.]|uniref:cytochrome c-type biogenesis protein n=1 Tax=Inhella sp. TaxID=1921806 RepID=UPI0035B33B9A